MNSDQDIKNIVKQKYGEVASSSGSCCGPGKGQSCCDPSVGVNFAEGYEQLAGYEPDADLALGCGLPTESSGIGPGHTVLDLGSGAGNDVFVARSLTGESGRVIGLDMVPEMVAKAKINAARLGHDNVEFILGEIEDIPLAEASVDVVISNCVLNLVPNKGQAFAEIFRVLKPGGHFSISDIVLEGELPEALADAAALYVGCVAGALQKQDYLDIITRTGFQDIVIHKERQISLPEPLLVSILGPDGASEFARSGVRIVSITVGGVRP